MGSHLYINIESRRSGNYGWSDLFEGRSTWLARSPIADAFCGFDYENGDKLIGDGYLTSEEIKKAQEHEECPWRLQEPYWVRQISGQEFCDIVRERRWKTLQDGDFADMQCGPELKAFAAAVQVLIAEGCEVRVWCWHSQ